MRASFCTHRPERQAQSERRIKCVVWDLDHTLWEGVLLEDEQVALRPQVLEAIRVFDSRGILQSIASKNHYDSAIAKLESLGIREYFLHPQIGWGSKSQSIEAIRDALNIGIDSMAFIDDQAFERDEVSFSHPRVLCIDAKELDGLLERPEMKPRIVSEEARRRRQLYRAAELRAEAERDFEGPKDAFLASLGMVFKVGRARAEDLQRAEELVLRTNQLNTSGDTYSQDELEFFRSSENHMLLMAELDDRYGSYGKVGLALLERTQAHWTIKLLLMSCRVMGRGVGSIFLSHILEQARRAGVSLRAEFVHNDRNRMMWITYKFAGFREVTKVGERLVLEHELHRIPAPPTFVRLQVEEL